MDFASGITSYFFAGSLFGPLLHWHIGWSKMEYMVSLNRVMVSMRIGMVKMSIWGGINEYVFSYIKKHRGW
jgi:hypothetical protein